MSALPSPCGLYRYRLERTVSDRGQTYGFFGVNPSTADAQLDDHTVRKWRGFVSRWNGCRFLVGNAFAFRATDVDELAGAADPVGPANDQHLKRIAARLTFSCRVGGKVGKVPARLRGRFDDVLAIVHATGKPVMHLGLTACGSPKHPLTLGYSTPLQEWGQT